VVANQDGALKLDMFTRIAIPTTDERDGLVIPLDAVQRVDNQPVVFVRESPTRFKRHDVALGPSAGNVVQVVSGLTKGDVIVTAGSFYLKTALLRERIGDEH
jgi:multidrug efflux pump subunit AcrA (membrane-fusion protein)